MKERDVDSPMGRLRAWMISLGVDSGDDDGAGMESDQGERTGLAPWQKVIGIIGFLVILVVVIALLVGGGHTPPVQHGAG